MKKFIICSFIILILACCQTGALSVKRDSQDIQTHLNSVEFHLLSLRKAIFRHNILDEAEDCLKKESGPCVQELKSKYDALSKKEQKAFVLKLYVQLQQFQKWGSALTDDQVKAQYEAYFSENFINDPITGAYWKCILSTLKKCDPPTQAPPTLLQKKSNDRNFQITLKKHLQAIKKAIFRHNGEDEAEECARKESGACLQDVKKKYETLPKKEQKEFLSKLMTQGKGFQKWASTLTDDQVKAQYEAYFAEHLTNDPVTGFYWTCLLNSLKKCDPATQAPPTLLQKKRNDRHFQITLKKHLQTIKKAIFRHNVEDEAEECARKESGTCLQDVKKKYETLPKKEQKEFLSKLMTQGKGFQKWASTLTDDQVKAQYEAYFAEHLTNDPVTGFYWTCLLNSLKKCDPATQAPPSLLQKKNKKHN